METVRLFYEEFGKGQPIIFLHGYPLDHTIWLPLVPLLKEHAHLILPDLRGHGRSPTPAGVYNMEVMAADVQAFMNDLKIEQAILAGHSMGGYVALAFARDHPQRLAGLALAASHCYADPPERLKLRLENAERVERTGGVAFITDAMLPSLSPNTAVLEKIKTIMTNANPVGMAGVLRGMTERKDTSAVLTNLAVPAVIIAGGKDQIIPLERTQQMESLMKQPWLEVISRAGHMPMLEAPEVFSRILLKLLEKTFMREIGENHVH